MGWESDTAAAARILACSIQGNLVFLGVSFVMGVLRYNRNEEGRGAAGGSMQTGITSFVRSFVGIADSCGH